MSREMIKPTAVHQAVCLLLGSGPPFALLRENGHLHFLPEDSDRYPHQRLRARHLPVYHELRSLTRRARNV